MRGVRGRKSSRKGRDSQGHSGNPGRPGWKRGREGGESRVKVWRGKEEERKLYSVAIVTNKLRRGQARGVPD